MVIDSKSRILTGVFLLTILVSCKKDLDFGLYQDGVTLNPEVTAPFINTSIGLQDLVDSLDVLVTDSSNFISMYYSIDSIANYDPNTLVTIPNQPAQSKTLSLGDVTAEDVTTNRNIEFTEIVSNLDQATSDSLQARDGTVSYFPPISPQSGGSFAVPPQSNFNYANLSSANLKVVVGNGLPVSFTSLGFEVQNASNGSVVTSISFTNLDSSEVDSQTVSLNGTYIESDLIVVITNLESPGSGANPNDSASYVPINLKDLITVDIEMTDVNIEDGEVVLPAQILPVESQSIGFNAGTVELERAILDSGIFWFEIDRDVMAEIQLNLSLPAVTDGGQAFSRTITVPPGNTPYSSSIDLTGLELDFTQSSLSNYNALDLEYQVQFQGTSVPVYVNATSPISFSYQMQNLGLGYKQGYFGDLGVDLIRFDYDMSNELLDRFEGTFLLADPKINLFIDNSAGVPLGLDLDLTAKKDNGNSENLNIQDFRVVAPSPGQAGQTIRSEMLINKTNYPSLPEFLSLVPDSLIAGVGFGLNPDGITHDNFLRNDSRLIISAEIEIPLELSASDIVLADLFEFEPGISDDSLVESVSLLFNVDNYFPLDAGVDFVLLDSNGIVLDTVTIDALQAATPDASGKVLVPHSYQQEVAFTDADLENIFRAKTLKVNARLGTLNNGAQPVKIYSDYTIDLKVAAEVKVKYSTP